MKPSHWFLAFVAIYSLVLTFDTFRKILIGVLLYFAVAVPLAMMFGMAAADPRKREVIRREKEDEWL